jgi:hypothetical protein
VTIRHLVLLTTAALTAAVLLIAPAARAHEATIAVDCRAATFNYSGFPHGTSSAAYTITVNGGTVASGVFTITGPAGTFDVVLNLTGNASVTASTSWTADGGGSASATQSLSCGTPTPPPPPPSPPPAPPPPPALPPPPPSSDDRPCANGSDAGKDGVAGNDSCAVIQPPTVSAPVTAAPAAEPSAATPPTVTVTTPVVVARATTKPNAKPKAALQPPVRKQTKAKPRAAHAKPVVGVKGKIVCAPGMRYSKQYGCTHIAHGNG